MQLEGGAVLSKPLISPAVGKRDGREHTALNKMHVSRGAGVGRGEGGGVAVEAMANDSRGQNRRRIGSKKEQPKINSTIPATCSSVSCPPQSTKQQSFGFFF